MNSYYNLTIAITPPLQFCGDCQLLLPRPFGPFQSLRWESRLSILHMAEQKKRNNPSPVARKAPAGTIGTTWDGEIFLSDRWDLAHCNAVCTGGKSSWQPNTYINKKSGCKDLGAGSAWVGWVCGAGGVGGGSLMWYWSGRHLQEWTNYGPGTISGTLIFFYWSVKLGRNDGG